MSRSERLSFSKNRRAREISGGVDPCPSVVCQKMCTHRVRIERRALRVRRQRWVPSQLRGSRTLAIPLRIAQIERSGGRWRRHGVQILTIRAIAGGIARDVGAERHRVASLGRSSTRHPLARKRARARARARNSASEAFAPFSRHTPSRRPPRVKRSRGNQKHFSRFAGADAA